MPEILPEWTYFALSAARASCTVSFCRPYGDSADEAKPEIERELFNHITLN